MYCGQQLCKLFTNSVDIHVHVHVEAIILHNWRTVSWISVFMSLSSCSAIIVDVHLLLQFLRFVFIGLRNKSLLGWR